MVRRADRRGGALRADQHHRPGDRVRRPDRPRPGRHRGRRPGRPADDQAPGQLLGNAAALRPAAAWPGRARRPDQGLAGRAGRRRPAARRPADRSRLMTQDTPAFPTSLGSSDADTITLLGQDLAADLMGKVGFGELALWLVILRRPTPSQVRVFEAVLVALADHGFTPTAIAARLTYLSAPDSVQGALAAGLLGGGSRFLGVTEDTGQLLAGVLARAGEPLPADDAGWDALALAAVTEARAAGRLIPGL